MAYGSVFCCFQVLTEPKNALGKQYKKMFQMNDVSYVLPFLIIEEEHNIYLFSIKIKSFDYFVCQVKLHFTEDALRLIAKKAISKNTGARGLRSMLENVLMDAMYEVSYVVTLSSLF